MVSTRGQLRGSQSKHNPQPTLSAPSSVHSIPHAIEQPQALEEDWISKMAPELKAKLIDLLPAGDVKNIRLMSREWAASGRRGMFNEAEGDFVNHGVFSIRPHLADMDRLREVAANSHLARHVKHLKIYIGGIARRRNFSIMHEGFPFYPAGIYYDLEEPEPVVRKRRKRAPSSKYQARLKKLKALKQERDTMLEGLQKKYDDVQNDVRFYIKDHCKIRPSLRVFHQALARHLHQNNFLRMSVFKNDVRCL